MIHKVRCEYLEVPITHKCNLSCEGCSAYANYGINREVSFIKYSEWMREVKSKLSIKYIRILGGEPFLHKELEEILRITRKLYPNASIGLCSNGLLSVGRESIFKALSECDISFHVSIHSRGEVYKRKIDKAMRYITEMMTKYGIKVTIGDNVSNWNRFYEGDGVDIVPFSDGDIKGSHRVCHSKHCLNLINGRLYKCPQSGNLRYLSETIALRPEWDEYLEYEGLDIKSSSAEYLSFITKSLEPEQICGMCPTKIVNYEKDIGI